MKRMWLLWLMLGMAVSVSAQTSAAPPTETWSMTASPITLPGNKVTVAGAETGVGINVTQNLQLGIDTLVGTAQSFQFYGVKANYHIPKFGTWLNNISPNLNGTNFDLYLTAAAGADIVTDNDTTHEHYAFMPMGMGLNYKIAGSSTWTFGVEAKYARFPGYNNSTAVVEIGPKINF